jgi:hypothetical protein
MSTRSAIIEKTANGFRGIYVHNDGYPEHNGRILAAHYTDPAKVSALIDLGDLSSLGEDITPEHTFAYGRDRGEDGTEPLERKTVSAVRKMIDHDYAYVFDGTTWTVNGKPLDEVLKKLKSKTTAK